MAEAPPHPNSWDMAAKVNMDTVNNTRMRKKLGLTRTNECHFEMPPSEVLKRYFGEYSVSTKASRTRDVPDPFSRKIMRFLLEVGCVNPNAYRMPKHKAGIII